MNDIEDITDNEISRAVRASRRADGNLWVAAFWSARVVGTYQRHGAAEIARQAGRSVSTVQNWAHAYWLYKALRESSEHVPNLRKALVISHFYAAYDMMVKYDLKLPVIFLHLEQMVYYKQNGQPYSAEALKQEIEAEQNGKPASWSWYEPRLRSMIANLIVLDGTPDEWREWLLDAPKG